MGTVSLDTVLDNCSHLVLLSKSLAADFALLEDKVRHVEREVQVLVTQISAINGAVEHLSLWLKQNDGATTMKRLPELSGVLSSSSDLLALISQHVAKVRGASKLKLKAVLAQAFGEEKLRKYQHMLQHQLQALGLLIQSLQTRSVSQRRLPFHPLENAMFPLQARPASEERQMDQNIRSSMHYLAAEQFGRKDSVLAPMDPSALSLERLALDAPSPGEEHPNFFDNMPQPTADPKISTERRYYTRKPALPKVDPYAGTEDDEDLHTSTFGLKLLGKTSRKAVIQFDKLTMPQILMDWPEWHREQRVKAANEGQDLTTVLNSGLYTAVRLKLIDYIDELFDNGAEETAGSGAKWTLTHHAVMFADERILSLLLERGVDPNISVDRHGTSLHYAVHHEDEKALHALLSYGANPNALDNNSRTPLYFALRYLLALNHACKHDDPKWPLGTGKDTLSRICSKLRPCIRIILMLLQHGAQPKSPADEIRWSTSLQQKLAQNQTRDLHQLVTLLADSKAPAVPEATVDIYMIIHHTLRDSLREAARGSLGTGGYDDTVSVKSKDSSSSGGSGGSVKSVHFDEHSDRRPSRQKKTADSQRLDALLGLT